MRDTCIYSHIREVTRQSRPLFFDTDRCVCTYNQWRRNSMGANIPPWIAATIVGITVLIAGVVGIGFARRVQSLPGTRPARVAWLLVGEVVLAGWLLAAFILGSQGFFQASPSN